MIIDEETFAKAKLTLESVERGWRTLLEMLLNCDTKIDGEGVYYLAEPLCTDLSNMLDALKAAQRTAGA